jgi:peptide/nickel transport system permease protein
MAGWIARRLLVAAFLIWVVSVITFVLYIKVPEDPAGFLVDIEHASPAQIAHARHELGVDRPVTTQYAKFVWRALHGDFGVSWGSVRLFNGGTVGAAVGPMVWNATKVTASLVVGGLALMLLIALPLGMLAASRPRSWLDRLSVALGIAAISTHPIVVGLLLQMFVGNRWHIAPPSGYCNLFGSAPKRQPGVFSSAQSSLQCAGAHAWFTHMILPWITFALFFLALYMRVVRARMMDVLEEPYIRTARAKGAGEARVLRHHALRNSVAPIVTMIGMDAGMAIGIAIYVETVFALPGLGRTTIVALGSPTGIDLPVILAVTLVAATAVILLNLLADIVVMAVDPRVARAGGHSVERAGSVA